MKPILKTPLVLDNVHAARFDEEVLWGVPGPEGSYQLEHSPFLSTAFACGDLVTVREHESRLVVEEVWRPSGHRTLQVLFAAALTDEDLESRLQQISDYRSGFEHAGGRYYAIDIPPEGNLRAVEAQVEYWQKRGIARYASDAAETQRLAHALKPPLLHWTLPSPRSAVALTVKQVWQDKEPVLHVVAGGPDPTEVPWQFLTWQTPTESDAHPVYLDEIIERDPTILALGGLPLGWHAWREDQDQEWEVAPLET